MATTLPLKHLVLVGLSSIFAAGIAYQLLRTPPQLGPVPPGERSNEPAADDVEPEPAISMLSFDDVAALDERPPFHPLRRFRMPAPEVFSDVQQANVTSPLPDLRLVGVVLAGPHKTAIVSASGGGDGISVVEQATVGGWTVDAISADRIVLSWGSETREILLHTKTDE